MSTPGAERSLQLLRRFGAVVLLGLSAPTLSSCAYRPPGPPATAPAPRETLTLDSLDRDIVNDRECWKLPAGGEPGPTPEEIEKLADPSIPDAKPRATRMVRPDVETAGVAHLKGDVVVSVLVDHTGRVTHACLWDASNTPLDALAIATAFEWEFEPGSHGGVPCPVWMALPFHFVGESGSR
jgi:TonB family protein